MNCNRIGRLIGLMSFLLVLSWSPLVMAQTPKPGSGKPSAAQKAKWLQEADELNSKASQLYVEGQYNDAIPLANQELELREKALGPDHADLTLTISFLALLYQIQENYLLAEPLMRRELAIQEKMLGPEDPNLAISITALAMLYKTQGNYAQAEPMYKRVLEIEEKSLGPNHPRVATSLNNLATLYLAQSDYSLAEPLLRRALEILEKLGPNHPRVATPLNNLAMLYQDQGDFARAEPLYKRALAIDEKALGREHPDVATSLNNLAMLYMEQGNYTRAEPMYKRALEIMEKNLGMEHQDVAIILSNLASLYKASGDFARAEELLQRALEILEKLGPQHLKVAIPLNNLAMLYESQEDYFRAEPLMKRALEIEEKVLGPEHPKVAISLGNLASLYRAKGDFIQAESLYKCALEILENKFGPDHSEVATSLNNLAVLYDALGDYSRAEPLYVRALAIREKAFGNDHPDVATSCRNLGILRLARGNSQQAIPLYARANAIAEMMMGQLVRGGSERRMLVYARSVQGDVASTISLHLQYASGSVDARDLAFTILLQRKARVLDAQSNHLAALRRNLTPENQKILDELTSVRQMLAAALLGSPWPNESLEEYKKRTTALREQAEKLEEKLGERAAQLKDLGRPVTIAAVQQVIPTDGVLLEYAHYQPLDAKTGKWGEPRYAAYGMTKRGIFHADLGPAAPIDAAVADLRNALADSSTGEAKVRRLAHRLYRLVLLPMETHFSLARHLLISPDGQLSLVPFGVLVNGKKRYLIEDHVITHLTTGRDLLRTQRKIPVRSGSVVLVNPQFSDKSSGTAVTDPGNDAKGPCGGRDWSALMHTADEGKVVASRLRAAHLLQGLGATEEALKGLRGPRMLHIATHGCFPKVDTERNRVASQTRGVMREEEAPSPPGETMISTGLLLAGANHHKSPGGPGDGVLTALEAGSLDLWGTRLVVLSACGTGLGDVKSGEGVYGLQRSMMLAGAETVAMSLWSVDDASTRDLMVEYYWRLSRGEGRSEAMRSSQLQLLKRPGQGHPFHWGAFIVGGDWRPLPDTEGFVKTPPRVSPRAGGCACRAGGGNAGAMGWGWGVLGVLGVLVLRGRVRRRRV